MRKAVEESQFVDALGAEQPMARIPLNCFLHESGSTSAEYTFTTKSAAGSNKMGC